MTLYKYRAIDENDLCKSIYRIKDIINGELYAASFNTLNDPMEGVYSYDLENEDLKKYKKIISENYEAKQKIKICSLSENYNNLALWGYYANGMNGVCIEIEVDEKSPGVTTKRTKNHIITEIKFNEDSKIKKIIYNYKLSN